MICPGSFVSPKMTSGTPLRCSRSGSARISIIDEKSSLKEFCNLCCKSSESCPSLRRSFNYKLLPSPCYKCFPRSKRSIQVHNKLCSQPGDLQEFTSLLELVG